MPNTWTISIFAIAIVGAALTVGLAAMTGGLSGGGAPWLIIGGLAAALLFRFFLARQGRDKR